MLKYSDNPQINDFFTEYVSSKLYSEPLQPVLVAESYLVLASRNYFTQLCDDYSKIAKSLEEYSSSRMISFVKNNINKYDTKTIKELIEFYVEKAGSRYNMDSPNTGSKVTQVVYHILDIKDHDSICDIGCGDGVTLANICLQAEKDHAHLDEISGIEINTLQANIAKLLCAILFSDRAEVNIKNCDALTDEDATYTKGYVYPPANLKSLFRTREYNSLLYPDIYFLSSYDEQWVFVDELLAGLKDEHSKGVALLSGKSLRYANQNTYLQKIIADGWIESIIALPPGMAIGTAAQTFLVIFSKCNKNVLFVDANPEKSYGRTSNLTLFNGSGSSCSAEAIIKAYDDALVGKYEDSIAVDIDSLKDVVYLMPQNILSSSSETSIDSGVPLESVAKVLIGCQYTTSVFDVTNEKTGYRILTSSDIEDGIISWDNLKNVVNDKNLRQDVYLHKNDVIITTKSTLVKVAVVDVEPEDHVIVTGGMIIVRPDSEKLNPTYLKMYLDSSAGVSALKAIQTGSIITHITPKALRTLLIPDVDITVQNKKAKRYNEKLIHLISSKNDIKRLERELKDVINEDEEL